ncbi:cytochrome P450 [Streptomyces sp. NPDC051677]|uniref:cytochrome P450 n=1 Tax=Streptomyces sp. NPDC051677 TaxID=3365669 RepID=UPI0037CFBA58
MAHHVDHFAQGRRKGAYLPFGAGDRKCIGDVFALTEAQVIVAQYGTRVGRVPGARWRSPAGSGSRRPR